MRMSFHVVNLADPLFSSRLAVVETRACYLNH